MDYEKKYNAVLQTAKQWIKDGCTDKEKICLECVFPELAESEDERIRKEMIGMINECTNWAHKKEYVKYLEKPKENPKSADSIPSDCVSDVKCEDRSPKHTDSFGTDIRDTPAYWRGWDDAMKQKEQEHPNGCFTCDEYKKGYEAGRFHGFTAGYNKAMKEQKPADEQFPPLEGLDAIKAKYYDDGFKNGFDEGVESVKPAEWSEEDERRKDGVIQWLREYQKEFNPKYDSLSIDSIESLIDWLKSLRPQSQGTYKQIIHSIYNMLKDKDFFEIRPPHLVSLLNDIRVKCKDADECATILDEPHWKPSKEQMYSLGTVVKGYDECTVGSVGYNLKELYEHLKKLM